MIALTHSTDFKLSLINARKVDVTVAPWVAQVLQHSSLFYTLVAAAHCRQTGVSYRITIPSLMCRSFM